MEEREKVASNPLVRRLPSNIKGPSRIAALCPAGLLLVMLAGLCVLPLHAQELVPHDHPNHYIILIDASGSARQQSKKAMFIRAVGEVLPKRLYEDGFGKDIPPIDPERDVVSLYHFGIVQGVPEPYYKHLNEFDLLTQFIHPVFVRREHVDAASLQSQIFPTQIYLLTFLTWSKQMTLWHSRSPSETAHRTFLITVHDGELNETGVQEELRTLSRNADESNYREAKQIVDQEISAKYRFIGGDAAIEGSQEKVLDPGSKEPIYLEAYRVVSVAQSEYESRLEKVAPFDDLSFSRGWGLGGEATGVLDARINGAFAELLRSAEGSSGSLVVMGQTTPKTDFRALGSRMEARVALSESASCRESSFTAVLNLDLPMKDKIVGARTVTYSYQKPFTVAPTFSCSWPFYAMIALGVFVGALVVLAVWYCVQYRLRTTHLKITLPGLVIPLRLSRHGVSSRRARVAPRANVQAFTLHLPHKLLQKYFYSNARLVLESADVYWNVTDTAGLVLPLERRTVTALWRVVPAERVVTTLRFEQGKQHSVVHLSHPSAEARPEEPLELDSLHAR